MQVAADQRALSFDTDLPQEFWIYTDNALVRRLVANLLGNAIAHAPRGSSVRISLSPAAELRISNPAPQLAPADIPRLGERFFRIGPGDRGSHAGLGLALASAIANVLGIRFRLELDPPGNLVARLDRFQTLAPRAGTPEAA